MRFSEEQIAQCVERAATLREQGFNCSQAVFAACADMYGMDEPIALRVSASFGGGIGQMRQTCGAACGMFLLAGMENGNTIPDNPQAKQINYNLVQQLAEGFKQEHGSLICADLLGLNGAPAKQKMNCKQMIMHSVRQYLNTLNQNDTTK